MRTAAFLALIATSHAAEIESTFFAGNLKDPIELAAAPDGDVYLIEREGRVLRLRPSTGGVFEIGNLDVTALRSNDRESNWAREATISSSWPATGNASPPRRRLSPRVTGSGLRHFPRT